MDRNEYVLQVDEDPFLRNLDWLRVIAIVLILLGLTALYAPFYSSFGPGRIFGFLILTGGAMFVAHAVRSRRWGGFSAEFLLGALYIATGLLVFFHPLELVPSLTLFLGVFYLAKGILKVGYSLRLQERSSWQWMLANGTVSVLTGIVVLAGLPSVAMWGVAVLVGLDLIFSGLTIFLFAHAMHAVVQGGNIFCIGNNCFQGA